MVSDDKIRDWDDEMWDIVRTFSPQLRADCDMNEEILHDGGVWIDKRDSELITETGHFLRVQMRYENNFHFGVVETDDDNREHRVFEEGSILDDRPRDERKEKARELLKRYGCLL